MFLFGTGLLWLDMRINFHHFAEKKSFERLEWKVFGNANYYYRCSYFFLPKPLIDLVRKLVRIGVIEFMLKPL